MKKHDLPQPQGGKKYEPWKRNTESGDPDYPWRSYVNEAGMMMYCVPFEAPTDIPVDTCESAKTHVYSWLNLFAGKKLRVYWEEMDDKAWAYDQKCWVDAEAQRNYRLPKRETPVAEVLGDGDNDGNRKVTWKLIDDVAEQNGEDPENVRQETTTQDEIRRAIEREADKAEKEGSGDEPEDKEKLPENKKLTYEPYHFPQTEPHAITLMELEEVRKYIETRHPRWWRALYLMEWYGADANDIADELNVNPSQTYHLADAARKLGRKYRDENR